MGQKLRNMRDEQFNWFVLKLKCLKELKVVLLKQIKFNKKSYKHLSDGSRRDEVVLNLILLPSNRNMSVDKTIESSS